MSLTDQRAQAWGYFELHARQRMQIFQFYLSLSTALLGGIGLMFRQDQPPLPILASLCLLLVVMSFVFYGLDQRTRQLIKHAEGHIKHLEAIESEEPLLPVFSTEKGSKGVPSYTKLFKVMYFFFVFMGLGALSVALLMGLAV